MLDRKKQRYYDVTMRLLVVCLLGVVFITGIAGHLLSLGQTSDVETEAPQEGRHESLANVLRTSENAFQWIQNKTKDSINELLNNKNRTSKVESAVTEDLKTLIEKKRHFLSWLKEKFHFNSGPASEEGSSESAEESGESLVIAHRNKDNGFSWGPPVKNSSLGQHAVTRGVVQSARHHIQSLLEYLAESTRSLRDRGKLLLQAGLTKVFAKRDPFLMLKTPQFVERQLETQGKTNANFGTPGVTINCDDNMKPVCAVDEDQRFTVFQNECQMLAFNNKHARNFSIRDSNICMDLFARHPGNFQAPQVEQEKTTS